MTYNEWRDELKSNLLCVPESEMLRVLDYYAEAYADRRDAGYSEREITAEFGAPYDAAQRILAESVEEYPTDTLCMGENHNGQSRPKSRPQTQSRQPKNQEYQSVEVQPQPAQYSSQYAEQKSDNKSWVFVLLCVIFSAPIFGIFMAMVGVTIGFSVAPFALIAAGVGTVIQGVVEIFSDITMGAATIGLGLVSLGLGLILAPIFFKVVKLLWKLFTKFFAWLKSLFSGKEKA